MAEEIEWDYALKKFLGSKKAEELKNKMKDYYFNPKYWRDSDIPDRVIRFNGPREKGIKGYICIDKTYKVEVVDLDSKEWNYVPDDCIGIQIYFPSKNMSEERKMERFEWQWRASTNNARIIYGLLEGKKI